MNRVIGGLSAKDIHFIGNSWGTNRPGYSSIQKSCFGVWHNKDILILALDFVLDYLLLPLIFDVVTSWSWTSGVIHSKDEKFWRLKSIQSIEIAFWRNRAVWPASTQGGVKNEDQVASHTGLHPDDAQRLWNITHLHGLSTNTLASGHISIGVTVHYRVA